MVKIGVISNGAAGRNAKKHLFRRKTRIERLEDCVRKLEARGENIVHMRSLGKDQYDTNVRIMQDHGVDLLYVNGGDGTLDKVITSAITQYRVEDMPIVSPMSGGTVNVVSNALGVPKRSFSKFAVDLLLGRTKQEYVLEYAAEHFGNVDRKSLKDACVNYQKVLRVKTGERTHYGLLFAFGIVHRFFQEYEKDKEKEKPGFWKAARIIAKKTLPAVYRTFLRAKPDTNSFFSPQTTTLSFSHPSLEPIEEEGKPYLGGVMSSINGRVYFLDAFHSVSPNDNKMHLTLGKNPRPVSLLHLVLRRCLPIEHWHDKEHPPGLEDYRPTRLTIKGFKGEFGYILGGDMYTTGEPLHLSSGGRIPVIDYALVHKLKRP
jgi:hypothetical protein